jgi:hypothetical protein
MAYVSPKMRNKITVTEEEEGWSVMGSNNKVVVPTATASSNAATSVQAVAGKWAPLPKAVSSGPEPLLTRQAFEKKATPADSAAAPVKKSAYVPPSQRSAEQKAAAKEEPKTFDEAFPELGKPAAAAAPVAKSGGWGSKGSGLNAILAAAAPKPVEIPIEDEITPMDSLKAKMRVRVVDISDREEPEDEVDTAYFAMLKKHNMALNRLHAAQRQRALEQSRRRQPIFESSSESEELSIEEEDHYSDYDDNSNEEEGEGEAYDPDSFDRHR